ncbi:hypothetical protein XENTR_v10016301 [Xenopus tropicalis]|nr:hypothetical protein XENTR_v10016301 [Xenopus tropicalis]
MIISEHPECASQTGINNGTFDRLRAKVEGTRCLAADIFIFTLPSPDTGSGTVTDRSCSRCKSYLYLIYGKAGVFQWHAGELFPKYLQLYHLPSIQSSVQEIQGK